MTDHILADRYRLDALVANGGMSSVYRARDLRRNVDVAVKVLRPDHANDGPSHRCLRAEGRMGRRVTHRNLVEIVDAGNTAARGPYVVMELVAGRTLRSLLQQGVALPLHAISAIVQQILAGLDSIHAAGFVHGDVKADNVLVDGEHATLIDLGLIRSRLRTDRTHQGVASGTPEYMAPEIIRGEPACLETDLYACGVLLYELLAGTTPFAGGAVIDVMCRHLDEPVVPVRVRAPHRVIPAAVEDVIARALEKQPAARFDSAGAFACAMAAATPVIEPPLEPAASSFSTDAPTVNCLRQQRSAER